MNDKFPFAEVISYEKKQRVEIYRNDTKKYKSLITLIEKKIFPEKIIFDRIYFAKDNIQITVQKLYIEVVIPKS